MYISIFIIHTLLFDIAFESDVICEIDITHLNVNITSNPREYGFSYIPNPNKHKNNTLKDAPKHLKHARFVVSMC